MEHTKNVVTGIAARAHVTPSQSTSLFRRWPLVTLLSIGGSLAFAQSLGITPSNNPSVTVGGTLQFAATANGFTISSLKWEVASVQGGSTATGTISTGLTGGLYTAPTAIPAQNPQSITAVATGTNGSKYSASAYVSIAPPPPVITSVSPNPLPTGTVGVTITGTGFTSSSLIWDSGVQYVTQRPSPNTLTTSVYTAPGTSSATFTVHGSGTISNAVVVPVGSAAGATYALTVVNGTGSGSYAAGTVVNIAATMPSGQQFQSWSGAAVANSNSSATTLTMPAANTTVTAQFTAAAGLAIASVSPNPLPTGTIAVAITGTGFTSSSLIWDSGVQYVTQQPSANTLTTSVYTAPGTASATFTIHSAGKISNAVTVPVSGPPTYTLTVVNGTGGGSYTAGTAVTIGANPPPAGESFAGWTGASVSNANATTTTLTMPAGNTTVTANFAAGPIYTLTVVGGQGSGNYVAGAVVTIVANIPPAGQSFLGWTGATVASPASSTTTLTMPAAPVTVTADFSQPTYTLTVVNGTGSGNYAAGAVVPISANAPPAGQYFQVWTGPGLANPNQPATTIAMPQANTTVTASFFAPAPVPFPVTTHPRLWITPQDLPHLQAWAVAGNPAYQGQSGALSTAIGNYSLAFPGAALNATSPAPANPYPDFGDTQGYTGILSEENAVILALNSLIDPSPANRAQYAQAARNLLMYAMNQAALGHATGLPFRDPAFAIYNRASGSGHEWPLIVDWIYPVLSAADKATIRQVFLSWAGDCLTAETTGGDNPGTPGLVNSLALLPNNLPYRMASNNYYLAHARLLTMMSLVLDPADDPPLSAAVAPGALGNTLRSYIADATGAWLYEEFAMMGDPEVVAQAYGVPNNPTGAGFGLASGGLPPEGMLYGESFAYILGQLLALQTSGFNNATYSGPQIAMIGAPVWDRYVTGYLSSLTPAAKLFSSEAYLGSLFQFAGYGDLLRTYVTPDQMAPFALLGLLDQETGVSTHVNAGRWYALNAMPNGAAGLLERMTDPWTWGVTQDLLYYLLLDPTAPAPTDPRPTFPTVFYDAPAGRIVAHSDWTPTGTMFDYRASWISINHQDGNGGQFELFRNGEWLTKEMSNYDNGGGGNGATVTYHNTLGLENWCPACATIAWQGTDAPAWTNGSQWMEGENAGDPTTTMSTGAGYVYAASNLTNLYNRPDFWTPADAVADITQATRSIVWLNNDFIVVYDRATSGHNGFKRFNLSLVSNPVVSANTATETLPSGQQLFIQTLLPLNPSLSSFNGAANLNPIADLEPSQYIYQVQDPALPLDTRFLHVLQGADPGALMATATYLQSGGATAFDGARFGASEVWFPVAAGAIFAGTTLPAPSGVQSVLITGLAPNTGYSVSIQAVATGNTIGVSPGGSNITDAGGVLQLAF